MDARLARIFLVLIALAIGASHAASAETTDAEALLTKGVELRKNGRDLDALPLFRRAAEKEPTPRVLAQLGTCEQAVGLWVDAEKHLMESLNHPDDPWIRKHDNALRQALAHVQEKLGSLDLWGTPEGARIKLDGQLVGTLPTKPPLRAVEGQRTLTVEASGFMPQQRLLQIVARSLVREHIALESLVTPRTTVAFPPHLPDSAAREEAPPERTVSDVAATDSGQSPIYKRWWFLTILGTAAVAGGISAYVILRNDEGCKAMPGGTCVTF